jgi:hypothetical protein
MKRSFFLACLVLLGLTAFVQAEQGNPKIKTIDAIAFGPDGLLLIGSGAQVVTVETGDTKPAKATPAPIDIANADKEIAGLLGLTAKDIQILKLAVNPASRKAYLAVRSLKTKQDVLLTINGAKFAEVPLEDVKFTRYPLTVDDKAITQLNDVAWIGGRIIAATKAGDTFGSRVFAINPFVKDGLVSFGTETFHTGHNKMETKAPLVCLMPYEEDGKTNVVGAFTCTPIVKYPLGDMKPESKVKGITVVELGQGNTPRSMFSYEKGGKKFILISVARNNKKPAFDFPSGYWVARVDYDLLKETTAVNEKAPWRVGGQIKAGDRVTVATDFFGTHQMAKLDDTRALVIREEKGGMSLRTLTLP